jgi:hypothetical protein
MRTIKDILSELQYYLSIRQTGKTTLLKKGVDEYPHYHWIVVPKIKYGRDIVDTKNNKLHKLVSLNNLQNIRGTHQAMIIDQEANLQIFNMTLSEFDRLEDTIKSRDNTISELYNLYDSNSSNLNELKEYLLESNSIKWWQFGKRKRHKMRAIQLLNSIITNR